MSVTEVIKEKITAKIPAVANITKFRWAEVFSNNNGKTSATGVTGVVAVFVGLGGFISGAIMCWIDSKIGAGSNVILQSLGLITLGFAALGVRKLSKDGDKPVAGDEETSQTTTEQSDTNNEQLLKS